MNKKPLVFILASLFSFQSFAQISFQEVQGGIAVAGSMAAVYSATSIIRKPLTTVALLALTGFAAYLVHQLGLKAIGWTKEKLVETFLDPSKHEEEFIDFMYEHPVIFDKLHKAILLASAKIKSPDALKVINEFIDYHHLGEDKEFDQIMQSAKYTEYVNYYTEQAKIIEEVGDYKKYCDMQKYKMVTTPISLTPYLSKQSELMYSVDHYRKMSISPYSANKNIKSENDHIPSKRTLQEFFKLPKINNTLIGNGIAVKVPLLIHVDGSRTHSIRNKKVSNGFKQYQHDSKNLLLTTIKDLSFTSTYMFIKGLPVVNYLTSGKYILEKNYELCLYN